MIVYAQDPALLDFANRVLGVKFDPAQSAWMAKTDGQSIEAVIVYTRFSPHNCEMSIATNGERKWATREFLRACYRYPFVQMGLRRITAVVEEDNSKSLNMCRRLGHAEEARLKHWFGEKDGIVFRMTKDTCKWL